MKCEKVFNYLPASHDLIVSVVLKYLTAKPTRW